MPRAKRKTPDEGTKGGAAAPPPLLAETTGPNFEEGIARLEEMHAALRGSADPLAPVFVVPNLAVRLHDMTATLTLTCRFPYPGNQMAADIVGEVCERVESLLAARLSAAGGRGN